MISQLLKENIRSCDAKNNYMYPHTNKLFTLFVEFEEQTGLEFYELFKFKELPKGTYLLKEGEISKKCYFIKKGISRSFQLRGKREMNMFFNFPNEFVDSYQSSALKIPSSINIQLLSDAVVYEFDWDMLNKYKLRFSVIWKIEELIIVSLLSAFENRLIDLQEKSATERYIDLLTNQPRLVKRVSLSHLANYIGCSAECVSRIRAKISCQPIHGF